MAGEESCIECDGKEVSFDSSSATELPEYACFVCMDTSGTLHSVCACVSQRIHLECQRKLVESVASHAGGRCPVCKQNYVNMSRVPRFKVRKIECTLVVFIVASILIIAMVIGLFCEEYAEHKKDAALAAAIVLGIPLMLAGMVIVYALRTREISYPFELRWAYRINGLSR